MPKKPMLSRQQIEELIDFQNGAANHGDKAAVKLIDRALENRDPQAIAEALQLFAEADEHLSEWDR